MCSQWSGTRLCWRLDGQLHFVSVLFAFFSSRADSARLTVTERVAVGLFPLDNRSRIEQQFLQRGPVPAINPRALWRVREHWPAPFLLPDFDCIRRGPLQFSRD